MSVEIIDPPAAELFTAEDFGVLRDHLSIGEGEFDDLVLLYASAARSAAETYLRRATLNRTVHVYFPDFNIEIFDGPVQSIEAVEYLDHVGNWVAIDPASYRVALRSQPVRVFSAAGSSWPIGLGGPESVRVTAILGMGAARDDIDPAIVQAIHMMTADFLENRGDAAQKGVGVHPGAEALLSPHRAWF